MPVSAKIILLISLIKISDQDTFTIRDLLKSRPASAAQGLGRTRMKSPRGSYVRHMCDEHHCGAHDFVCSLPLPGVRLQLLDSGASLFPVCGAAAAAKTSHVS